MALTVLSRPLYLVVFFVAVLVAVAPQVVRITRQRSNADGQQRDRGSKWILIASTAVGWLVAFWIARTVPVATIGAQPLAFGLGITLILGGAAIRWYAIRTLGGYFTDTVMIHSDQEVVSAGPYRWVRHPSYTGGLVFFSGFGVVLANWISVVVLLVATLVGYAYRIRVEERVLREELGESYRKFLRRTPYRLVPFVW